MEENIQEDLTKGVELHIAGEFELAGQFYSSVIKLEPNHADANHNMGLLKIDTGYELEALPYLQTALQADTSIAQFWLSYIQLLIKLKRVEEASRILNLAKESGIEGEAFSDLHQQLNDQPKIDASDNSCDDETSSATTNILDTLKLDKALQLAKKKLTDDAFQEAKSIYQDILKKFPKNKKAISGLRSLEEKPTGQTSASLDPSQPQLQSLVNLYGQGKLQQALDQANALSRQFPSSSALYNISGAVYKGLGQLDSSIEAYKKAIRIKPDFAEAHGNLGVTLKEQGKLNEAIEAYKKALAIKPEYAEAYNSMGNALNEQGNIKEAIVAYNKALSLRPNFPEYMNNLAMLLFAAKQYKEAAKLFEKDTSSKSQTYLLKCLYEQDKQADFYDQLDYLITRGDNNAVIGSYISRSEIRYGVNKENPFCNKPLKYVLKTDLKHEYDFENIFVRGAKDILNNDLVQRRSQSLLTKGIQTTGNVFNQIGDVSGEIQNILRLEIENYRIRFENSQEGLIKNWPLNYDIDGWLVSMKSGGQLAAHIHDRGWLSGSIYINVPPKSKKDSGNLVVTSEEATHENGAPRNRESLDVVTGSLCLFPSSLLHYTLPFEADEERIVLAFDVIPK